MSHISNQPVNPAQLREHISLVTEHMGLSNENTLALLSIVQTYAERIDELEARVQELEDRNTIQDHKNRTP